MVRYQASIRVVILAGFTGLYAMAWHYSGDDSPTPTYAPAVTERPALIRPYFDFALGGTQVGDRIGWAPRAVPEPRYSGVASALGRWSGTALAARDPSFDRGQLGALLAQRRTPETAPEVASSFLRPAAELEGSWRRVRRYRNLPIDVHDDVIGARTFERLSR